MTAESWSDLSGPTGSLRRGGVLVLVGFVIDLIVGLYGMEFDKAI